MRALGLALGLSLLVAACETMGPDAGPAPLPDSGPIIYSCADGTQLEVTFEGDSARVAIVGGRSMVLPNTGTASAPHYTNGRYGLRGGGRSAEWAIGRAAPTACRGS